MATEAITITAVTADAMTLSNGTRFPLRAKRTEPRGEVTMLTWDVAGGERRGGFEIGIPIDGEDEMRAWLRRIRLLDEPEPVLHSSWFCRCLEAVIAFCKRIWK